MTQCFPAEGRVSPPSTQPTAPAPCAGCTHTQESQSPSPCPHCLDLRSISSLLFSPSSNPPPAMFASRAQPVASVLRYPSTPPWTLDPPLRPHSPPSLPLSIPPSCSSDQSRHPHPSPVLPNHKQTPNLHADHPSLHQRFSIYHTRLLSLLDFNHLSSLLPSATLVNRRSDTPDRQTRPCS